MKLFTFILMSLLVLLSACTKKENVQVAIDDCASLVDATVLTQAERGMACMYNDVYRWNGKIYTICSCCVCDKWPVAVDCNGQSLCDFPGDCMDVFWGTAEYLFSVEG